MAISIDNANLDALCIPILKSGFTALNILPSLVGLSGVFITGCPLRQLANTGQGNTDAAVNVPGMLTGAAFAHNFSYASSPAGVTENGIKRTEKSVTEKFCGIICYRCTAQNNHRM
nr:hypothetical protein [Morganella morganii]